MGPTGYIIALETGAKQWPKVDFDIHDKRKLLNWMLDRNLSPDIPWFWAKIEGIPHINFLEQAVLWDDFDFLKEYFENLIIGKGLLLNEENSTPWSFAQSVDVAQLLLDHGASLDTHMRKLTLERTKNPVTILEYLELTSTNVMLLH